MADNRFIRFFDKLGNDTNFSLASAEKVSLYTGATSSYQYFQGGVYFPKVSVGLIESQQLFLLQEVTGPSSQYELRRIQGTATLTGGSDTVTGVSSNFGILQVGNSVKIGNDTFTVTSVGGSASFTISPTPSYSLTTEDIYYYDYLNYSQPRTSIGTFNEKLKGSIQKRGKYDTVDQTEFFFYDVNYGESIPIIERSFDSSYELADGSSDTVDPLTGRIDLSSGVFRLPVQINLGFSTGLTASFGNIFEKELYLTYEREYTEQLISVPYTSSGNFVFEIGGTHSLFTDTEFYLQGVTGAGATVSYFSQKLEIVEVGLTGSDTYIKVKPFSSPSIALSNLGDFRILWKNSDPLAVLNMYAESEGEDERFRLVLENFGKKIDFDKEYIFRDSDINEDLPDYKLLNKKRKELLLEGDTIYPYMGSYRALINIINYFGYYDLRIKEYFLNVDANSSNYGKYMHVLVPKDQSQWKEVKQAWEVLPSTIYKKTSLFGLFYDLNRTTENEDIYGIPEVVDAFDFSPEEVLIKLFGLKELLKKEYLPLNARIYDITGEGIYFERIRVDSWADNLNHLVLNLGEKPQFTIYPQGFTYLNDIRRIDKFYERKFIEQGLTGFIAGTATNPGITPATSVGPIQQLYNTYVESYNLFLEEPYGSVIDTTWNYMPPGIDDPDFNDKASRVTPLPDDLDIVSGGPVLLETFFNIDWEECDFTWAQLGILGPSGSPLNINFWTWESLGRGERIDMRWVIEKGGENGFFYDSGRRPISEFLVNTEGSVNYAVQATLSVGLSGGTISSVSITNPGFGYTSAPDVTVSWPGPSGATAQISVTIDSDGYVDTATIVDPGSGYNFIPFVNVDFPDPVYEVSQRYLHAVALPYAGIYDVSLYTYDITNNFSVDYQKYEVKNWNVDFVSIHREETTARSWADFIIPSSVPGGLPEPISWNDVTGPWYYPLHVKSSWADAQTSWESLNFSSFDGNDLFEYSLNTSIVSIDRTAPMLVVSGNLLSDSQVSSVLNVGDYIFLSRETSDPVETNLPVQANSFGNFLYGEYAIGSTTLAYISGASGSSDLTATDSSTLVQIALDNTLSAGDQLLIGDSWYTVSNVSGATATLTSPLNTTITNVNLPVFTGSDIVSVFYTSTYIPDLAPYSRILATFDPDYNTFTQGSFYSYFDSLQIMGNEIVMKGDPATIKSLIQSNHGSTQYPIYLSWGLFTGTYAIQITNLGTTGSNTFFRLDDSNKELYYIDGNFSVRLADYDVDYAENRIGPGALTYENANETTWDENLSITWFGMEYHQGNLCGYVIPFVSPGGTITVDENPTFSFSGNFQIDSTKSGLTIAAQELNESLNEGVNKYDYSVLPEDEIYLTDITGSPLTVAADAMYGSTYISVSQPVSSTNMKIPAIIEVTISGGSVTGVNIVSEGFGYLTAPEITVEPAPGMGVTAVLSCTITGAPYAGRISSVSIVNAGSGYIASPTVEVAFPDDYKPLDNLIWTGKEWLKVSSIDFANDYLILENPVTYDVNTGDSLLLPYQYHKQLYARPDLFQGFYYFIHGKAKNPSNSMLSYVILGNGVESEWVQHPDRTYTYPLRNSLFFSGVPAYSELSQDFLYNKWVYEGADYPPSEIDVTYQSDVISYESRIPYSMTTQNPYSYIDTVISSEQTSISQYTPVIFTYDKCRIPGKKNPLWTIKDETTGKIEMMSSEKSFMWNFTKTGSFTVSLQIEDSNGNKSFGQKNSFIVV